MAKALASQNVIPNFDVGAFAKGGQNSSGRVVTANETLTKDVVLEDAHSIVVVVNISSFTSGTLTVTIKGVSQTGAAWTLLASSALGAAAVTTLTVSPDLTASANAIAQAVVPQHIQIVAAAAGGASFTYTIDVETGY